MLGDVAQRRVGCRARAGRSTIGSPSKSMTTQRCTVRRTCAEVQVAVDALRPSTPRRCAPRTRRRSRAARASSSSSGATAGPPSVQPRAHRRGLRARTSSAPASRMSRTPRRDRRAPRPIATPSRSASPAKSPPASSACRSASAIRSRTLALASSQPSVAVVMNSCSIASECGSPSMSASTEPSRRAMCRAPCSASAAWISMSGLMPGLQAAEHLEHRRRRRRSATCWTARR